MKEPENKIGNVTKMLLAVIVMLAGVSLLGSFRLEGWSSRKVNLFSDLTQGLNENENELPDDSTFFARMTPPSPKPDSTAGPRDLAQTTPTITSAEEVTASPPPRPERDNAPAPRPAPTEGDTTVTVQPNFIAIEDFSENGMALWHFFDALRRREELGRPVRIAFLGDSFIEGDILTSDLREYLQTRYGGAGVGFVPLAPIDRYRNTLNVEHEGWEIQSSLYSGEHSPYLLNGQCFIPEGFAFTAFRTTQQRKQIETFHTASLLYINEGEATLQYSINGGEKEEATLPTGSPLRLFEVKHEKIRSGQFSVQTEGGFTGYGLFLNDETGVCVDNYSLRSSSGIQLGRISRSALTRLNGLIPYDLIILQYGMNVVEADRKDYSAYIESMLRVIARLREAIPEASILVFAVGDRNYRLEDGSMGTKVGVLNLVEAQRTLAQEAGVAFWNTYLAMGGRNSMSRFVAQQPAWANRDYTHINYHGGRKIGQWFGQSLEEAQYRYE